MALEIQMAQANKQANTKNFKISFMRSDVMKADVKKINGKAMKLNFFSSSKFASFTLLEYS
jgi:hypothetical protein